MDALCNNCKKLPPVHTVWGPEVRRSVFLCCACFVTAGNRPFAKHKECVEAEKQKNKPTSAYWMFLG